MFPSFIIKFILTQRKAWEPIRIGGERQFWNNLQDVLSFQTSMLWLTSGCWKSHKSSQQSIHSVYEVSRAAMGFFCVLQSDAKYFVSAELICPISWYAVLSLGHRLWQPSFVFQNHNIYIFLGDGKRNGRGWKASSVPKSFVSSVECLMCFLRASSNACWNQWESLQGFSLYTDVHIFITYCNCILVTWLWDALIHKIHLWEFCHRGLLSWLLHGGVQCLG